MVQTKEIWRYSDIRIYFTRKGKRISPNYESGRVIIILYYYYYYIWGKIRLSGKFDYPDWSWSRGVRITELLLYYIFPTSVRFLFLVGSVRPSIADILCRLRMAHNQIKYLHCKFIGLLLIWKLLILACL